MDQLVTSGDVLPPAGTVVEIFTGSNGYQALDLDVQASVIDKGNYMYSSGGTPGSMTSLGGDTLPNSLFRTSKPPWFGNLAWPPFDPTAPNSAAYDRIPAGYRFLRGVDPPGVSATTPPTVTTPPTATTPPPATTPPTTIPGAATSGSTIYIGETGVLASPDSNNANLLLAQQATLTQTAIVQGLSFYVTNATGSLILGIYDATGPNGGPGALRAQTETFNPTAGWNAKNVITPVSLPAGTYWLAYLPSSNGLGFVKNLSGLTKHYQYPFGPMPSTFSTSPTSAVVHWSLFASLVTSAQPPATTPPTTIPGAATSGSTIYIGETGVLTSPDSNNANLLLAQQATLTQTAIVQGLSFYVTNATGSLILGIYDATGPNGGPGALRAQTETFNPTAGWNAKNVITPVSLPAGTYWLAYLPSSNGLGFVKNLSGLTKHYQYPFGPMPSTFSTSPTSAVVHWSLFASLVTSP